MCPIIGSSASESGSDSESSIQGASSPRTDTEVSDDISADEEFREEVDVVQPQRNMRLGLPNMLRDQRGAYWK